MALIRLLDGSNTLTSFNLNGLEYQKGLYEIAYYNVEVDTDLNLIESEVKVGLRNKFNNELLYSPSKIDRWLNEDSIPFSNLTDLLSYIVDKVFKLGGNNDTTGVIITQKVNTFSDLADGTEIGVLSYVSNPQGTPWLPGSLGGSYYSEGFYVWDGIEWVSDRNAISNQIQQNILDIVANQVDISNITDGDSAYEIALINGFVGTEQDWLNSLQGAQGIQGLPGNDGADGAQGIQGLPGNDGADGAQGIQGLPGNDGADGAQGIQGLPGNDGADGAQGIQGLPGNDGADGAQGIQGLPGNDGADGAQGIQGLPGNDAPDSADGVSYDNSSGLNSANVQDAVDEVFALLPDTSVSPVATVADAQGTTLGLEQSLLANAGQPARTVLAVGYTTTGKIQGSSLGDGNVIEAYANGEDFNNGIILYRVFKSLGEPFMFTGLSDGAIITSTSGYYGFSDQTDGADVSPMGLLSYGLSFKKTFMFAFRNCQTYNPGVATGNQGWIHVVNGPLNSVLKITNGAGVTVQGQEGIELSPWQYQRLYTSGNQEYIIESTNPVMACHNANMDSNPFGRFYDSRLIMPLTNDGITHPRSGFISALYDNTEVKFYVRDGVSGVINSNAGTGVSPGSPVDFDAAIGVGTGASDQDYEPNGATRVLATGLISAYSGADSAGLEASPLMPTSAMSQVVAQPLFIEDNGDGGNSGVSISSPYVGTAKVYSWSFVNNELELQYTVPLNRNNVTITSKEDQRHPSSGLVANETSNGSILLVGRLDPGVIIADVPIHVVVQSGTTGTGTLPNQDGVSTLTISNNDDETLTLGWTPPNLKAEIIEGADNILYIREVSGGIENWRQG